MLSDYITAIDTIVPNIEEGTPEMKLKAVNNAVNYHSRIKPKRLTQDVDGNGTGSYDVSMILTGWNEDFSEIISVIYPLSENEYLGRYKFETRRQPSGQILYFSEDVPQEGEQFRVTYTGYHTVDNTDDTVMLFDRLAVELLAASYYCEILSNEFATNQSSLIQADSVDHENKSQAFSRRANSLRAMYFRHMGLPEGYDKKVAGAFAIAVLDIEDDNLVVSS